MELDRPSMPEPGDVFTMLVAGYMEVRFVITELVMARGKLGFAISMEREDGSWYPHPSTVPSLGDLYAHETGLVYHGKDLALLAQAEKDSREYYDEHMKRLLLRKE